MRPTSDSSTVTIFGDPRVTPVGRWLRKYKLDELPQFYNILVGDMSFVGPRPDVPGFADLLSGKDATLLHIRPGLTGLATVYFRQEERLLQEADSPIDFNRDYLWPRKVKFNLLYIKKWSIFLDLKIIYMTLFC